MEKENVILRTSEHIAPVAHHSLVVRHSPVREVHVRRSVSPLRVGDPLSVGPVIETRYSGYMPPEMTRSMVYS